MDPLFEKTMTPYQYTYQNPINYTDPTGMSAENDYELTSDGHLEDRGGDTTRDRVFTSEHFENGKLKAGTKSSDGYDFGEGSGGFIKENSTSSPYVVTSGVKKGNYEYDVINFGSNEDIGLGYFKFVADNTSVEFSIITESGVTRLGTLHQGSWNLSRYTNAENVTLFGHNHPGLHLDTVTPSGLDITVLDSKNNIIKSTRTGVGGDMNVVKSNNFKVNHFIYAPHYLDGAKTIFYNREGAISPIKDGFQPK